LPAQRPDRRLAAHTKHTTPDSRSVLNLTSSYLLFTTRPNLRSERETAGATVRRFGPVIESCAFFSTKPYYHASDDENRHRGRTLGTPQFSGLRPRPDSQLAVVRRSIGSRRLSPPCTLRKDPLQGGGVTRTPPPPPRFQVVADDDGVTPRRARRDELRRAGDLDVGGRVRDLLLGKQYLLVPVPVQPSVVVRTALLLHLLLPATLSAGAVDRPKRLLIVVRESTRRRSGTVCVCVCEMAMTWTRMA